MSYNDEWSLKVIVSSLIYINQLQELVSILYWRKDMKNSIRLEISNDKIKI